MQASRRGQGEGASRRRCYHDGEGGGWVTALVSARSVGGDLGCGERRLGAAGTAVAGFAGERRSGATGIAVAGRDHGGRGHGGFAAPSMTGGGEDGGGTVERGR